MINNFLATIPAAAAAAAAASLLQHSGALEMKGERD
jgi:hypothetical protein